MVSLNWRTTDPTKGGGEVEYNRNLTASKPPSTESNNSIY